MGRCDGAMAVGVTCRMLGSEADRGSEGAGGRTFRRGGGLISLGECRLAAPHSPEKVVIERVRGVFAGPGRERPQRVCLRP